MRVLLPPGTAVEGQRCRLSEEESHHLRVRRAAEGELVEIRDGAIRIASHERQRAVG